MHPFANIWGAAGVPRPTQLEEWLRTNVAMEIRTQPETLPCHDCPMQTMPHNGKSDGQVLIEVGTQPIQHDHLTSCLRAKQRGAFDTTSDVTSRGASFRFNLSKYASCCVLLP